MEYCLFLKTPRKKKTIIKNKMFVGGSNTIATVSRSWRQRRRRRRGILFKVRTGHVGHRRSTFHLNGNNSFLYINGKYWFSELTISQPKKRTNPWRVIRCREHCWGRKLHGAIVPINPFRSFFVIRSFGHPSRSFLL